ncbi:unnamed protein product [Prorocentrum cordatum]|uniref:Endonuclease/exonuclease/phosphatase domain-containing protein n=1 Tax=Prorocentrum cordatum TaxID=2364126 RepID=A0ABN9T6C4_9DINO|nr:unnamed protein product [Polarella glacialis]
MMPRCESSKRNEQSLMDAVDKAFMRKVDGRPYSVYANSGLILGKADAMLSLTSQVAEIAAECRFWISDQSFVNLVRYYMMKERGEDKVLMFPDMEKTASLGHYSWYFWTEDGWLANKDTKEKLYVVHQYDRAPQAKMLTELIWNKTAEWIRKHVMAVVYHRFTRYYRYASREAQRLESITRSPIFALLTESQAGVATIRGYGIGRGPRTLAAGVATILPKLASELDVTSNASAVVQGRVLRVDVVGQGFQLVHFNIHNHGLNAMQIDEICAEIDAARVRAAADPLHFLVIVQGDLNFGPDEALLLQRTLGLFLEISSESPTHYTKDTNSVSCLDRFFCSVPGWMMCQMCAESSTIGEPEELSRSLISDHAALLTVLRQRHARPRSEQPVPRHIFESPLFRQRIEGMFKDGAGAETVCSAAVYQEHFKDMLKEDVREQYGVKIFLSPVGWWRPRLPQLACSTSEVHKSSFGILNRWFCVLFETAIGLLLLLRKGLLPSRSIGVLSSRARKSISKPLRLISNSSVPHLCSQTSHHLRERRFEILFLVLATLPLGSTDCRAPHGLLPIAAWKYYVL